ATARGSDHGALSSPRGRLLIPPKAEQPRRAMTSIARRPEGTCRPRYRDADGKEHSRHFARKVDAQRWLDEVTATVVTGMYVDPKAGRVTFREYAELWRGAQ